MKIAVTGSSGLVGGCLLDVLKEHGPVPITHDRLDITDISATCRLFDEIKPDIVIHLAAYTDVDGCEKDVRKAFLVNGLGTKNVVVSCRETGAKIIYLSSDFVFDGKKGGPYTESDDTCPVSVYAKSKLVGEYCVEQLAGKFAIVRSSRIFGKNGKNFASRLPGLLIERDDLPLVVDQVNSPTYAPDLACAIKTLCDEGFEGKINFCNTGWCSWMDFGKEICEVLKLVPCGVRPAHAADMGLPAVRPDFSALDTSLFSSRFFSPRTWQEAVRDFLR